jgi:hypothetical protein
MPEEFLTSGRCTMKAAEIGNRGKTSTAVEVGALTLLAAVLLFLLVLLAPRYGVLSGADFLVPYTGGLIFQQGHASKLYDVGEQLRVQRQFVNLPRLALDPYPPFHAPLFGLLARLGYRNAYIAWGMINVLLWVFFFGLVWKEPAVRNRPFRYLALSSLFYPLILALLLGQVSIVLLVSLALAFFFLKRNRDYAAGFALGLGLLKFQVVLPFAFIFLLRRKWRFIAGLSICALVLGVLSLAAVGVVGVISYMNLLVDVFRHPSNPAYLGIKPWNMPTIRGFVTGLFRGRVPQFWISALWVTLSACLIMLATWSWKREERQDRWRQSLNLMFATAVVVSLIATPYLQAHDLTPVLLSVILITASPQWVAKSRQRQVVTAAVSILYASPLYFSPLFSRGVLYALAPLLAAFALATVALARRCGIEQISTPASLQTKSSRDVAAVSPIE